MTLLRSLEEGPVDIVGDVHGDAVGLENLLTRLGYADAHPQGRRLVFVGDLVDRGPDCPSVVARVRELVEAGVAECLLGNHELNLLLGLERHGNGWFRGEDEPGMPARQIDPDDRAGCLQFFAERPVGLERPGLRIVHACWQGVEGLRGCAEDPGVAVRRFDAEVEASLGDAVADYLQRVRALRAEPEPPFDPVVAEVGLRRQTGNPVRVATSGLEQRAAAPFRVGGRWRMLRRARWWRDYDEPTPVVVGHYLRSPDGPKDPFDAPPFAWLGPRGNCFCVDYVGRVAALRIPEWRLVFADGQSVEVGPPPMAAS